MTQGILAPLTKEEHKLGSIYANQPDRYKQNNTKDLHTNQVDSLKPFLTPP